MYLDSRRSCNNLFLYVFVSQVKIGVAAVKSEQFASMPV